MPLAGIGSRFVAVLIDTRLPRGARCPDRPVSHRGAFRRAFNRISFQWGVAIVVFLVFLFNWGYFTLFEAFWNGRTPGRIIAKIPVIQRSGRPIGLFESMARNFIRYGQFHRSMPWRDGGARPNSTSGWAIWPRAPWWCAIGSKIAAVARVRARAHSRGEPPSPRRRLREPQMLVTRGRGDRQALPCRPGGAGRVLRVAAGHARFALPEPANGLLLPSGPNPAWSGLPESAQRHLWRPQRAACGMWPG